MTAHRRPSLPAYTLARRVRFRVSGMPGSFNRDRQCPRPKHHETHPPMVRGLQRGRRRIGLSIALDAWPRQKTFSWRKLMTPGSSTAVKACESPEPVCPASRTRRALLVYRPRGQFAKEVATSCPSLGRPSLGVMVVPDNGSLPALQVGAGVRQSERETGVSGADVHPDPLERRPPGSPHCRRTFVHSRECTGGHDCYRLSVTNAKYSAATSSVKHGMWTTGACSIQLYRTPALHAVKDEPVDENCLHFSQSFPCNKKCVVRFLSNGKVQICPRRDFSTCKNMGGNLVLAESTQTRSASIFLFFFRASWVM